MREAINTCQQLNNNKFVSHDSYRWPRSVAPTSQPTVTHRDSSALGFYAKLAQENWTATASAGWLVALIACLMRPNAYCTCCRCSTLRTSCTTKTWSDKQSKASSSCTLAAAGAARIQSMHRHFPAVSSLWRAGLIERRAFSVCMPRRKACSSTACIRGKACTRSKSRKRLTMVCVAAVKSLGTLIPFPSN